MRWIEGHPAPSWRLQASEHPEFDQTFAGVTTGFMVVLIYLFARCREREAEPAGR